MAEIQLLVKHTVEESIENRISPLFFLHHAKYITTDFRDKPVLKVEIRKNKYCKIDSYD